MRFIHVKALILGVFISVIVLVRAEPRFSAVVRSTPSLIVAGGCGDCEATELWLRNKISLQSELLLRGANNLDTTQIIGDISDPVFSQDESTIYFTSAAWAVSRSVQKFEIKSKKVTFLIDGNAVNVIRGGKYDGMLLVERALIKFDKNGESLGRDIYLWLVTATGKPIREIGLAEGEEAKRFRAIHNSGEQ